MSQLLHLTRLVTTVSHLTHHSPCRTIVPLFLNLAFWSIHDLRRIRSTLDFTTVKTIAKSLIHIKVDYCNSLFLNLPRFQLDRLQLVLNSAARAVFGTPHFTHISPVLESLHWLRIAERINYKILSIAYKTLQSRNPAYLHNLLRIQFDTCNRSYTLVTLKRPTVCSRLKITTKSFTHHAPVLWNALPKEFRQLALHSSCAIQFGSTPPLLGLSLSQFYSKLKTHLFHKCSVMSIGRRVNDDGFKLDDQTVKSVNTVRDLGVQFCSNLTFASHIDKIVAKAHARASLIHKCFLSKDATTLTKAFITYVRPILEYASVINMVALSCR